MSARVATEERAAGQPSTGTHALKLQAVPHRALAQRHADLRAVPDLVRPREDGRGQLLARRLEPQLDRLVGLRLRGAEERLGRLGGDGWC